MESSFIFKFTRSDKIDIKFYDTTDRFGELYRKYIEDADTTKSLIMNYGINHEKGKIPIFYVNRPNVFINKNKFNCYISSNIKALCKNNLACSDLIDVKYVTPNKKNILFNIKRYIIIDMKHNSFE